MSLVTCPLDGAETEEVARYAQSISSDGQLLDQGVENRMCLRCGLVFNATGGRGSEAGFYADVYDLHSESATSEFMVFDQGEAKGTHANLLEFLCPHELPQRGRLLEIGCGKGLFLSTFARRLPEWELEAVEPSKNAHAYFSQVMPQLDLFEGMFAESPHAHRAYDLIVLNGVLEHVPDPRAFLLEVAACLAPGGRLFVGVPNFANNPTDLFTFDHLSRFTPPTLARLFAEVGLRPRREWTLPSRVPMWHLVEQGEAAPAPALDLPRDMVREHLRFVEGSFAAFSAASQAPAAERIGVYGLGAIALLGTVFTPLTPARIHAFYDDNHTMWGSARLGVPVQDPSGLDADAVRHVVFSANPCYLPQLEERARALAPAARLYLPL